MNATQRKQAIEAVASIGQLLLAADWNYQDMIEISRAKRQLDKLLHAAISVDLSSAHKLSVVASRDVTKAGSVRLTGTTHYCRGCGFAFDQSNPIAAAPHTSH